MSNANEPSGAAESAATPLLIRADESELKIELQPLRASSQAPSDSAAVDAARPISPPHHHANVLAQTLSNEYRFVQQRIPPREGALRFVLPALLLFFQLAFIILFAFFGHYADSKLINGDQDTRKYSMFEDLHAITLLGFGFLMTFLKRYGYGSVGFNLLLVAFVVQWTLLIRGWIEWNYAHDGHFKIGLENLVYADFTAIAVLVSFGALLGKTTLAQLVVLALVEVVVQVFNEYLNVKIIKAYDSGRSVYVHLFGALFGLAASKALHFKGVKSYKQASVYHSDLFSLIGTLFLWVYYPSFNGLLAKNTLVNDTFSDGQTKAIVNTFAAISASCVVTFAISSLAGKGKINAYHVQHATIAGGIAIGTVADLNVHIYVALIAGSFAGLLSTISYQYIDTFFARVLKIHDTCSVLSLHAIPGLIAALLGIIFAAVSSHAEYRRTLYDIYPGRLPKFNSTEFFEQGIVDRTGEGRNAGEQAAFQIAALVITISFALVLGALTGLVLRLPLFEQLSEDVEMFDDEAQWVTPDDYALKLTLASNSQSQRHLATESVASEKKNDASKV